MRAPRRPSASWFFRHVVFALGQLTHDKPYVGVDLERVIETVLSLSGIKRTSPPWEVTCSHDEPHHIVSVCFRDLRPGYCQARDHLTVLQSDGTWALSRDGASMARQLRATWRPYRFRKKTAAEFFQPIETPVEEAPVEETPVEVEEKSDEPTGKPISLDSLRPGETLTVAYIREHGVELRERLIAYLKPRYPTSAQQGMIEDHVQHFCANLIARDSLGRNPEHRETILKGGKIPVSKICTYARNSTNSQIRDNGRRPLHRILQGARTKKELDSTLTVEDWTRQVTVTPDFVPRGNDGEWVNPTESMTDDSMLSSIEEKMAYQQGLESFMRAFRKRAPSQADDYASLIYDRFVLEMSVRECAEKRGITRNQTSAMLRQAKTILAREFDRGSLATELGL